MSKKCKFIVVGAGLSGSTVARLLAEKGHKIVVMEKSDHVAGNAFDYVIDDGHRIHKYGPHLFHTNNVKVFEFLSRFTEWVKYEHKVKALLEDGRLVTLPVNKETKEIVGEENVIDIFFRPYTEKMWGMSLERVSPSIMNRVPIRDDMNELYFPNDDIQVLPKDGYTKMVENMLDHENINVMTGCDFMEFGKTGYGGDFIASADWIFNSMPIDEYFNYIHGHLPYRSLKFHHATLPLENVLQAATVNFTNTGPYTRITEWSKLPNSYGSSETSAVMWEEPCAAEENGDRKFYPVKDVDGENRKLYEKYKKMARPYSITFIGRLGLYAYLDMDQAVNSAMRAAEDFK